MLVINARRGFEVGASKSERITLLYVMTGCSLSGEVKGGRERGNGEKAQANAQADAKAEAKAMAKTETQT